MKAVKSNSGLSSRISQCVAGVMLCFATLACCLAIAIAQPTAAQALTSGDLTTQAAAGVEKKLEQSGTVNASSLSASVDPLDTIMLAGDTVLNLDTDFSCAGINCKNGTEYDLTIQGSGSLSINNNANFACGIEDAASLTITSGTVSIAVSSTGIDCDGNVTISGGTVSILVISDGGTQPGTAISASGTISIDNASVYCVGGISTTAAFGNGITIGSGARLTAITRADSNYGPMYVGRGNRKNDDDTFDGNVDLRISGSMEPSSATVDYQYYKGNIVSGKEDSANGVYYGVIRDGSSFPAEVKINDGATEAAVKTAITDNMVTGVEDKAFTGSAIEQTPVIKDGSYTLVKNTDYKLVYSSYADYVNAIKKSWDAVAVYIIGIGKYAYMSSKTFMILPAAVTPEFSLGKNAKITWDGQVHKPLPSAKVVYNGTTYWLGRPTDAEERSSSPVFEAVAAIHLLAIAENQIPWRKSRTLIERGAVSV